MMRAPAVLLGLASVAGTPLTAQPSNVLDLATVVPADGIVRWVYGSVGTGAFGVPVAGGFDCDGDGFRDVAVGHFMASPLSRPLAGEVDLVFGDGTTGGFVDTATDNPAILRFAGAGNRETAGSEVWMDDVTGDGVGDLLICRQNFRADATRVGAGALSIVAGGPELRTHAATLQFVDLAAPPAALTITTVVGAAAVDRLCIWTRTGDVTGDGVADIVVGADQVDQPGNSNSGAIYVIRGGTHLAVGGTIDLQWFGTTVLAGHLARVTPPAGSAGYHFGATCQIADLDGNGHAEVLAAAALARAGAAIPGEDAPPGSAQSSGGAPDGNLYIAWDDNFPAGIWPAGYSFDISASPGARTILRGENVNIRFGEEILGGLDYDMDGDADLFVGDLVADGTPAQNRPGSGFGHVFYNAATLRGQEFDLDTPPAGLTITRIYGPSNGALGADTAAHGDFDSDGLADLAFASPHDSPLGRDIAGTIHVFYGRPGGWPSTVDLLPANLPPPAVIRIAEIQGAHGTVGSDDGDTLGYSAAAGDIDGDGRTDLIANEMVGNGLLPNTIDTGNLIVISGLAITGPALTLAKTLLSNADEDGSGDVTVDDTLTYGLVATNSGNVTLTNVAISDPLPGLSTLSCTPAQPASLAPGAGLSCTATYVVTATDETAGAICNTATASSDQTPGTIASETVPLIDGSIGDTVWCDQTNPNGMPDPGEGLVDITVNLFEDTDCDMTVGGAPIETQDTDASGDYLFGSLPVGPSGNPRCYVVRVDTADLALATCGMLFTPSEYAVELDVDNPSSTGNDFGVPVELMSFTIE